MRLQIVSDLHLEFGGDGISDAGADLLIVAGDLHTKLNGVRWLLEHWRRCPAIYVCGNHEFYGARLPRLIDKMKAEAVGSDITVLENEFADLGGYRFFGGTLWTDMALFGDQFVGSALAGVLNINYYGFAGNLVVAIIGALLILWVFGRAKRG